MASVFQVLKNCVIAHIATCINESFFEKRRTENIARRKYINASFYKRICWIRCLTALNTLQFILIGNLNRSLS